jgi:hypothetical protein
LHAPASRRGDHREPPTALLRSLKRERRAEGACIAQREHLGDAQREHRTEGASHRAIHCTARMLNGARCTSTAV